MTVEDVTAWCEARGWTVYQAQDIDGVVLIEATMECGAGVEVTVDGPDCTVRLECGPEDGAATVEAEGHGATLGAAWDDLRAALRLAVRWVG